MLLRVVPVGSFCMALGCSSKFQTISRMAVGVLQLRVWKLYYRFMALSIILRPRTPMQTSFACWASLGKLPGFLDVEPVDRASDR